MKSALLVKCLTALICFVIFVGRANAQCPAPISVNNDAGKCGAVVNYTVTLPYDTITFNYTGAVQPWTVPSNVRSITAVVYGAKGSNGWGSGGPGGLMKASFNVTPGQTLIIYVGGQGSGTNGGYNGGGNGVNGHFGVGGGGGGASDIRTGGTTLNDRIIVGGGGGGSGAGPGYPPCASGGSGGGTNGGTGDGECGDGGSGGTQASAGSGGSFGQGGNAVYMDIGGGGGGGGGWYGGGISDSKGAGGGSGYVSATGTLLSAQNGVQNGNGLVYILIPAMSVNQTAGSRSGTLFPVGTTTNNFTFKDYQDKASYCSFTVTVADKESPVPVVSSLPAITSQCAVTVSAPKATDNCSGSITGTTTDPVTYSTPGTYTIHWTYTDNAGNTSTQSQMVTITQSNPPTISSQINVDCNGNTTGSVTVTASSGNAPYSYSINGTDFTNTSGTFGSLAAGNYTITAKDANGCSTTVPVTITQLAAVSGIITSQTNVSCNGNSNGSVTITGSGGTAPYSYSTDGTTFSNTSGTFSSLAAGNYTVIAKDAHGCTSSVPFTITQPSALSDAITSQTNVSCKGNSNGSVTVTATGGTSPYSFSTDGTTFSNASGTFVSLAAGNYTITVKDANGCTASVPVIITQPSALSDSITAQTNATCNGNSNGSVTVTGNGGTSPYSYSSNGIDFSNTSGTFSSLAAGSYTVTVKDANGCTAPVPVTISQPAIVQAPVVTVSNNCGSSTLSTTATGSLLWSTGATTSSIIVSTAGTYTVTQTVNGCTSPADSVIAAPKIIPSAPAVTDVDNCGSSTLSTTATGSLLWSTGETTPSITVSNAGTYTVTQTINGCTSTAGSGTANPKTIPAAPVVTVTNSCGSSTLSTTAQGVLLWSTGATTASITVTTAGTYTVMQTVNGCTSAADSVTASPYPVLNTPIIISQANVSCNGNSNGSVTITGNGGTSPYSYSSNGTDFSNTSGTFGSLTAGNYTIVVKDAHGCTSPVQVTITQPSLLSGVITSQANVSCNGSSNGSVTVTGNGGTTPYSFSNNGTDFSNTSGTFSSLPAGNYAITVKDAHGCTSTIPVTISQPPAISITSVTQSSITCNGGSAQVALSATGGTGVLSYTFDGVTNTMGVFTHAAGTSLAYSVRDANNCSSTTGTVTITQPAPVTVVQSHTDAACNGAANGTATLTASGGTAPYSYTLGNTTNATGSFSGLAAGSYNYSVTDANRCTAATGLVTIGQPSVIPAPTVTVINNCGSSTLSTTATGRLLWSTRDTTASIIVTTAGTYTVTQTVNGCTSAAGSGTAAPKTVPATPVITVTNNCSSSTLSTTATGTLLWSNGATTSSITVTTSGSYKVTVTNASGCSSTSNAVTVTITVDTQKPVITCPVVPAAFCYAASNTYTIPSLQATDNCGIASTTYSITGATTRTGTGTNASGQFNPGTSTIAWTVKDGSGNVSTCQTTVVVNPKFTLTLPDGWAIGSGCVVNTVYIGYTPASYISLIAIPCGGKAPYKYKWSNGATTSFIIVNPASVTTYTVTVTDASGCTQTASKQINVADVRCGAKMNMVTLCYKGVAICANQKDVANYLLSGAYLGKCNTVASKSANEIVENKAREQNDLTLKASPNPSTGYFTLTVNSSNVTEKINLLIVDEVGRAMETRTVSAGQTLRVGNSYHPGVYFIQALQGNQRVTLKLIRENL